MRSYATDLLTTALVTLAAPTALRLARSLLVEIVRLIAITTGQTLVKDYIEQHFRKRVGHRSDPGATPQPERQASSHAGPQG